MTYWPSIAAVFSESDSYSWFVSKAVNLLSGGTFCIHSFTLKSNKFCSLVSYRMWFVGNDSRQSFTGKLGCGFFTTLKNAVGSPNSSAMGQMHPIAIRILFLLQRMCALMGCTMATYLQRTWTGFCVVSTRNKLLLFLGMYHSAALVQSWDGFWRWLGAWVGALETESLSRGWMVVLWWKRVMGPNLSNWASVIPACGQNGDWSLNLFSQRREPRAFTVLIGLVKALQD